MKNIDDIIGKLSTRRQKTVRKRAAELIAEHKANAARASAEKNCTRGRYRLWMTGSSVYSATFIFNGLDDFMPTRSVE